MMAYVENAATLVKLGKELARISKDSRLDYFTLYGAEIERMKRKLDQRKNNIEKICEP